MRLLLTFALFLAAAPAVAQPPADPPRQLGRAKPAAAYDVGKFRAVKGQDGKLRYFPRLSKNADVGRLTVNLPAAVDWSAKAPAVARRMYANDRLGCCVLSSRYHQIGFMTGADTGVGLEATDAEVVNSYHAACGGGDNGCDMSAVNLFQQRVGIKVNGVVHKAKGSVSIDHTNKELVKAGIYFFGGMNVGMELPNAWYSSPDGAVWDTTNTSIVGGHEVQAFGYDDKGVKISTWGGTRTITWAAFLSGRWVDETYVTLSPDWVGTDALAPNGVDVATLEADLALIAGGTVPPLPEPPPPTPPGPTPPTPPAPGKGFSGTIATVQQYKDGAKVGEPLTIVGGAAAGEYDGADLKAAGVNPALIADVLQLLQAVRARDRAAVLAAVTKLLADLALAEPAPVPQQMPARREPTHTTPQ